MHDYSELSINATGAGDGGLTADSIQQIAGTGVMADEQKFRRLVEVTDFFRGRPYGDDEFRLIMGRKRIVDYPPLDYIYEYTRNKLEEQEINTKLEAVRKRLKAYE